MKCVHLIVILSCFFKDAVFLDPCTQAQLMDEPLRSIGYKVKDTDYENLICDRLLPVGWYKFGQGNQMPESCPDLYRCGTHVPLWLHGTHPSTADGIVTIEVCGHTPTGCCGYKNSVKVKNCGNYYAYELRPTFGCSAAYCAGTGVPCPADKWSPTMFEPGCVPAYPKMTQSPHLSNPILKPDTFEFNCHIPFDPTRNDVGFEVTWYADGKPLSKNATIVTGRDRDAQLDQKYLEDHLGHDLTCEVRTFFLKSPGRRGPKVPSNPYWVGIKVSTPRLIVGENEKPKTVQLISTIPIVCTKSNQASCKLQIYLDPNNHDIRQTTSCTQTLGPKDWNPVTHQAVTSFQVLAERDYKKDGDKLLDMHFRPIFSVDVPPTFNNYHIPYMQIQTKDKDTALCSCTGDPHCTTLDGQLGPHHARFNYYKVGEFTMYKSTSRPFEVQARTWHCGRVSCNCAVAAREGNDVITIDLCHGRYGHSYPKVHVQHQGQLSQGTVVHQNKAGNQFIIDFPSGAWVKAVCSSRSMNIYIHAPEDDFGATVGLCGTFNKRTSDDLTDRNGVVHKWESVPNSFVDSWRVPLGTSMFDKEVPIQTKYNNDIYYCNCDQQKKLVDCRIDGKALRPGVHTRCAGCSVLTVQGNQPRNGRRRRNAPLVDTEGPQKYYFDYGLLYFPTLGSFPTKSGITQTDAEKACKDAMVGNPVVKKCISDIGIDITPDLESCVDDIKQMDNHDFIKSAVESVIMNCIEVAITNPQYYDNSTGLPPAFITIDRCPSECSGNGVCHHGVCRCHSGFTGDACHFNTATLPTLYGIDTTNAYARTSDICDTTIKPCKTVVVIGENFIPSETYICRLSELKFDGTKFVPTGHSVTVGSDYLSMYSVRCKLPAKSSTQGAVAIGYSISVGTSRSKYNGTVPVYIVNSTCMDCQPNGGHCTIKADTCLIDGTCRGKGEVSSSTSSHVCDPKTNNKQWTVAHHQPAHTTKKPVVTSHKPTVTHAQTPNGHTTPPIPFHVAPLGGTELKRFDVWTITKTGCQCSFNKALYTCACCDEGGCHCPGANAHQCVHCGDTKSCGTPQPGPDFGVDGYTLALADCGCLFDHTQSNCACCQDNVNACQCGKEHRNQCVDCHHMDRCGSKPWIFGPAIPST